ncbi:hypothetical protein VTI28DRAFT_7277 [Corynascus sepedonium]
MGVLCGPAFVVSGTLDVREESGPPALASGDQKAMSPAGESFQYCGVDSLAFEKLEGEEKGRQDMGSLNSRQGLGSSEALVCLSTWAHFQSQSLLAPKRDKKTVVRCLGYFCADKLMQQEPCRAIVQSQGSKPGLKNINPNSVKNYTSLPARV